MIAEMHGWHQLQNLRDHKEHSGRRYLYIYISPDGESPLWKLLFCAGTIIKVARMGERGKSGGGVRQRGGVKMT